MNRRRKSSVILALSMLLFSSILFSACAGNREKQADDGRIRVLCSVYPVYDFAKKVAGEYAQVSLLVPPGVEAHDWEPSPTDIVALEEGDVLLLNGAGMEFWSEKILGSLENKDLIVVDSSMGVTLRTSDGYDHAVNDDHEKHDHGDYDPHVWLNPLNAQKQLLAIAEGLIQADPGNGEAYRENSERVASECEALDRAYRDALASYDGHSIIVAHEAYGYLCDAYGLKQVGIEGIRSNSEPDPASMADIVDMMKAEGIHTVFYETGASPKVAEAIARSTGATVAALNPLEGLSQQDMDGGKDYFSEMQGNLDALVDALSAE